MRERHGFRQLCRFLGCHVSFQAPRQNPEAVVGATASRACGYGSNFRLRELQSAIGRIQLQRLPEWSAARIRTALLSGCLSLVSWGRPA